MVTPGTLPNRHKRNLDIFLIRGRAQADDERGKVLFRCMDAEQ